MMANRRLSHRAEKWFSCTCSTSRACVASGTGSRSAILCIAGVTAGAEGLRGFRGGVGEKCESDLKTHLCQDAVGRSS
jgi:hypothetical protein